MKTGRRTDEMKQNNKGFSLVELIVTILIVAIIAGGAVVSFNVVYNANTDRAAKRLIAALNETREQAMVGEDDSTYYLKLYATTDGYKADICLNSDATVIAEKEIGNKRVSIDVAKKNGVDNTPVALGEDCEIVSFVFDKKRGALARTTLLKTDGTVTASTSGENDMYIDVNVTGSITNEVIIVPATGRSYIYKD